MNDHQHATLTRYRARCEAIGADLIAVHHEVVPASQHSAHAARRKEVAALLLNWQTRERHLTRCYERLPELEAMDLSPAKRVSIKARNLNQLLKDFDAHVAELEYRRTCIRELEAMINGT